MTPLLWVLSLILVGVGMAGVLVPGLPGTPLVFGGLLLAAWADGFQNVGVGTIILLAVRDRPSPSAWISFPPASAPSVPAPAARR